MKDTMIINFYGGPGSGKSTSAYMLCGKLKSEGISCELVTEYAKDVVWWGAEAKLEDQLYVFAKQHSRIRRLIGKVDYIVTDSPLLISLVYGMRETPTFKALVREVVNSYRNYNVFLNRTKEYDPNGRLQTKEEAIDIDYGMLTMLESVGAIYKCMDGDADVANKVMCDIHEKYLLG